MTRTRASAQVEYLGAFACHQAAFRAPRGISLGACLGVSKSLFKIF